MLDPGIEIAEKRSALDRLFSPQFVAVIGATDREGGVGRTVLANLCSGSYHGTV